MSTDCWAFGRSTTTRDARLGGVVPWSLFVVVTEDGFGLEGVACAVVGVELFWFINIGVLQKISNFYTF